MGLSRNKVAVSEGAAGSPPFYGESGKDLRKLTVFQVDFKNDDWRINRLSLLEPVVQFSVTSQEALKTEKPGGVAQLGEHLPCKQGVMGSIPIISTKAKETSPGRQGSLRLPEQ